MLLEFHGKCGNVSQADVDYLNEQGTGFRCEPCNKQRRKSMRLEYSEDGVTLDVIMKMLKEIQEEQKNTVADFNRSYEVHNSKLDENILTVKNGMERIEEYVKEIEALRSENKALKTKITDLEYRVDDLENYSRRNCLEIQGIPEERNEKVSEVVREVGKALKFDITEGMIDACHRIGKNRDSERPRGIIVKFVRRTDKETLMSKRRERKRDFSTRHLGMTMDTPVYVNDSLSPARRRLLAQARQIRKDKGYKYIWLRNGTILLRKEEGSPVLEVKSQADLSEL